MRKSQSPARAEYDSTYRELRLYGGWSEEERFFTYYTEIQDCALLSYDMQLSVFVGWICYERMLKFNRQRQPSPATFRFPF